MDLFKMFSRTAVGTGQSVNVGIYLREALCLLCSLFGALQGGEDSEVKLVPSVATGGPSRPLNIVYKMSRVLDPDSSSPSGIFLASNFDSLCCFSSCTLCLCASAPFSEEPPQQQVQGQDLTR